jgi:hypothetical protein
MSCKNSNDYELHQPFHLHSIHLRICVYSLFDQLWDLGHKNDLELFCSVSELLLWYDPLAKVWVVKGYQ